MKPQWAIIRIDETEFWNKDFLKKLGENIVMKGVYIYDKTERTYCCEITPSYFLTFIGTEISGSINYNNEEDFYERMDEEIRDAERQNDSSHYRHCWCCNSEDLDIEAENIDEVIEQIQSNCGAYSKEWFVTG